MSLAIIFSRASTGIQAPLVTVETHIAKGMRNFLIVGLPETAVKESRDRVRSALLNSEFEFPRGRITVNLAPADVPKEGGRFDLPIALGILAASGQIPLEKLSYYEFTGELALTGELRPVRGVLPIALGAKKSGRLLIVPAGNAAEAALVQDNEFLQAKHLLEVCAYLKGTQDLAVCERKTPKNITKATLDLADVRGQLHAKRALEIAAAGKHSLLLIGPPGTGKTMLASRIPSILPPLNEAQALEVAAVVSMSQKGFDAEVWQQLPYRAPHHTASSIALVGGGRPPKPGEISLAHQGVLFLDELPEFNRHVLECLREPLESGAITISRAAHQMIFPAQFQLLAAMNPCPCGHAGNRWQTCYCSEEKIARYLGKLSAPLLDRIDMQIEVPALEPDVLSDRAENETSLTVLARVLIAREQQYQRQQKCNADLTVKELERFCHLDTAATRLLTQVMQQFHFSARVYHRIIKVAQTLADLTRSDQINAEHISEAMTFRSLDKAKIVYNEHSGKN